VREATAHAFMITCHWIFREVPCFADPFTVIHACLHQRREDGGHQMQCKPRRSASYSKSMVAMESWSVSPGDTTVVHTGNQLFRFNRPG
jgi:hypothetical protein